MQEQRTKIWHVVSWIDSSREQPKPGHYIINFNNNKFRDRNNHEFAERSWFVTHSKSETWTAYSHYYLYWSGTLLPEDFQEAKRDAVVERAHVVNNANMTLSMPCAQQHSSVSSNGNGSTSGPITCPSPT